MRVAAVFFDCDSTLSRLEGIEELARRADPAVRDEIARLTREAMEGRVPLEAVYAARLERIRPSREDVAAIGRRYVETLVDGAREVILELHRRGIATGVVSGGLLPAVREAASALGIAPANVHAVDVRFDAAGAYAGFDRASPLARAGGKALLLARDDVAPRPLCFVGDGETDLEARPAVDVFVGYGGVARRARVEAGADHFLPDEDLRALLALPLFGPAS